MYQEKNKKEVIVDPRIQVQGCLRFRSSRDLSPDEPNV